MNTRSTKVLDKQQNKQLFELWNAEYPAILSYNGLNDFEKSYLNNLEDANHIVFEINNTIIAWYFDFFRSHERWFGIIINSAYHSQGLGTQLLNKGKANNSSLCGWVVDHDNYKKQNGEVYRSPLSFYKKNDFITIPDQRIESGELSAVKIYWQK